MSRKKILIVSDYISGTFGGIETYIHNLKKVLPESEYKLEYFGGKNIKGWKKYFFLLFSNFNFVYARNFEKKIQEFKPDIIWFHSISRLLGPLVIEKLKDFKGEKIMTYHDFGYFALYAKDIYDEDDIPKKFELKEFLSKSGIKGYLLLPYSIYKFFRLKKLRKYLKKYITTHTVPSDFMTKYPKNLGYAKNVEVLPNYILKENLIDRKDIFQDKINFIFFGRLEKEKGVGLLIAFLASLWEMKFKNNKKYKEIIGKIRIFIFGNGKLEKELIETFVGEDLNGKDISILQVLNEVNGDLKKYIDKDENKFIYYFGRRDFQTIKEFISFSHYNLVCSLFLETFGLSALEGASNGLVNIGFDKNNIKNFILDKFLIENKNIVENFKQKMYEIIENHTKQDWEKYSEKSKKIAEKYII